MVDSTRISITGDRAGVARPRILVVDDSLVSRTHILATLAHFADASAVESGAAAIRALAGGGFALVLCDYEMPDMSGLQLLRLLRSKHSALELPILLLTGSENPEIKVRAFRAGANDYIAKQAAPEELLARVHTQIELLEAQRRLALANARRSEGQKFEAMGQLTEALAHELNTPAQYIGDNLCFLRESFDAIRNLIEEIRRDEAVHSPRWKALLAAADCDYLFQEIPRCIEKSQQGIAHVSGVVAVMREFARQGPQQAGIHDINELVRGAIAVTRGRWHDVAELSLDLQEPLTPVHCFATPIKQVLLYAIMNAIKAMTPQDGVQRARGELRIRSRAQTDWVSVEITDTGRGIAADRLAKMLDPALAGPALGATGQALAQIRAVIVVDHGGQLEVDSVPGKGTRLLMRLPHRPEA